MMRASAGFLAIVVFGVAWAQIDEQEQSFTCQKPDQIVNAVVFSGAANVYTEVERSCWIDWYQAQARATGKGGQWVDVRDAGAARSIVLPGVATVHLADLDDKTFLKGQSLVLVGTGVDLKVLSSRCAELRHSGQFEGVHVLLGGVRSWRMTGQPVLIDGHTLSAQEISARELWLGVVDGLWQVAAMGLSSEQIASLPIQRKYILDLGADMQQAVVQMSKRFRHEPLPIPRQWLVIVDTPEHLVLARDLWQQVTDVTANPLWLSGGLPAYATFLEQQKTLAANAGRSLPRLCGM